MSDESATERNVLIDVSGLSVDDLGEFANSSLMRAVRRILVADDESDVIAAWGNCP
jgi:hypothetical protein